jgi:hypothetical protein
MNLNQMNKELPASSTLSHYRIVSKIGSQKECEQLQSCEESFKEFLSPRVAKRNPGMELANAFSVRLRQAACCPLSHRRDFVSRSTRILNAGPQSFFRECVAVADATGLYFYPHVPCAWLRNLALDDLEICSWCGNLRDFHWCHSYFCRCHKSSFQFLAVLFHIGSCCRASSPLDWPHKESFRRLLAGLSWPHFGIIAVNISPGGPENY